MLGLRPCAVPAAAPPWPDVSPAPACPCHARRAGQQPLLAQFRQPLGQGGEAGDAAAEEPCCARCAASASAATLRLCSSCRAVAYCGRHAAALPCPALRCTAGWEAGGGRRVCSCLRGPMALASLLLTPPSCHPTLHCRDCQLADWADRHSRECGQLQELSRWVLAGGQPAAAAEAAAGSSGGLGGPAAQLLAAALKRRRSREGSMLAALLAAAQKVYSSSGGSSGANGDAAAAPTALEVAAGEEGAAAAGDASPEEEAPAADAQAAGDSTAEPAAAAGGDGAGDGSGGSEPEAAAAVAAEAVPVDESSA